MTMTSTSTDNKINMSTHMHLSRERIKMIQLLLERKMIIEQLEDMTRHTCSIWDSLMVRRINSLSIKHPATKAKKMQLFLKNQLNINISIARPSVNLPWKQHF
jgi:hypothetical protein